jgi:hypothetical protein
VADTKVSGLTAAASFLATHEFPVNEAGTSKKVTGAQIQATVAQGSGGASWYAQVTANQGTFVAQTDLTSLTVTVTPLAGRRIRVTGWVAAFTSSVTGDTAALFIMEGATQLAQANTDCPVGGGFAQAVAILTPTAVAHTYKLAASRSNGTGNVTMNAAVTYPAFILVEDIGT